jgi:hypothetical protein
VIALKNWVPSADIHQFSCQRVKTSIQYMSVDSIHTEIKGKPGYSPYLTFQAESYAMKAELN